MKVKDLPKNHPARIKRRKRIAVWTFALIMMAALVAPFSGFLLSGINSAVAQEQAADSNPRADYWRAVKGGVGGYSSICLLYTSPSPRDKRQSRMPSSA